MAMTHDTRRGAILREAKELTEGARNKTYSDPKIQLALAGDIKQLIRKYHSEYGIRMIGSGEWEATDTEITKISRRILGSFHMDNYVDSAAYAAIAGECGEAFEKLLSPDPEEEN